MKIIQLDTLTVLYEKVKEYKQNWYFFVWEFMKEENTEQDKIFVVLEKDWNIIVLENIHNNQEELPKISDIYYAAHHFENEIYDFYGKKIAWNKAHILKLHLDKKDYFPKRILWKSSIKEKKEYVFTEVKGEWNVKVQVWPIHAWIISPWHFRFTCDGENVLNLDIQLWWKHRWVEQYFMKEENLEKLLQASEEIVWDSRLAYSLNFVKLIENASGLQLSKEEKEERVILLELERIYNHLWTMGAMLNDVGQWFLLNWFLSIREEILNLLNNVYGSRTLKWVIWIWYNKINLDKWKVNLILDVLTNIQKRYNELFILWKDSAGVYDRFKWTWKVFYETALAHSAVGIGAKASWLYKDARKYDTYYKDIEINNIVWEEGDVFDRYVVRWEEVLQSIRIIQNILKNHKLVKNTKDTKNLKLKDGLYIQFTEWHRWEKFMLMEVKNGKISYFKIKDPSFVNWTLLEYAVLNNIIADFPICNKSFDLSYSGFDL